MLWATEAISKSSGRNVFCTKKKSLDASLYEKVIYYLTLDWTALSWKLVHFFSTIMINASKALRFPGIVDEPLTFLFAEKLGNHVFLRYFSAKEEYEEAFFVKISTRRQSLNCGRFMHWLVTLMHPLTSATSSLSYLIRLEKNLQWNVHQRFW